VLEVSIPSGAKARRFHFAYGVAKATPFQRKGIAYQRKGITYQREGIAYQREELPKKKRRSGNGTPLVEWMKAV
jgi:hypothetical protein